MAKRKISCADFSFPLLPYEHVLDLIARLGCQGVDLGLIAKRTHKWNQPEEVLGNVSASARELRRLYGERGLEFADVYLIPATDFHTLACNHPEAAERKRSRELFLKSLELTAQLEGKHMTGLPGVHWEQEAWDDSFARSSAELAWRVEQAREQGIVYSIEAHLGSLLLTPAQARQMVDATPGLTLTLDYGHFTYQGMPDAQVEPLVAHASHFHARCSCPGRLQAPMSMNTNDFCRILKVMDAQGYAGYLGIEYVWIEWDHCQDVDNLSETILLRDLLLSCPS